jgi:chromosome transmission fidelity protein 1
MIPHRSPYLYFRLDNQPDWITALQGKSQINKKKAELENRRRELRQRIDRIRDVEKNNKTIIELVEKSTLNKKRLKGSKSVDDDEDFLIGDYESDDENGPSSILNKSDTNSNLSKEVQALLAK